MSTATYIGYDLVTHGDWQSSGQERGTAGYWLSDTDASTFAASLPSYITGVVFGSTNWDGGGPSAYRLTRPGGGTALTGRLYSSSTRQIVIAASDGAPHYISIYCCDDTAFGRSQTLTVKTTGGATLASHSIDYDFSEGVWVTFLVSGEVDVHVSIDSGPNFVVSGVAWDETEPPMATAGAGGGAAYTETPSGGVELGGVAAAILATAPAPSGGVALGGSTPAPLGFSPTSSGGLSLGGSASAAVAIVAAASGGLALGGEADAGGSHAYSQTASGGVALGGSTPAPVVFSPTSSGGLGLGGSTSAAVAIVAASSGGLALGGAADLGGSHAYTATASGGLGLGGSSGSIVAYVRTASGGLGLGGEAVVVGEPLHFVAIASGGLRFGGAIFDPTAAGTIHQAVVARLRGTTAVVDVVGSRIYYRSLPQTAVYPAVTYFIPVRPYGHNLGGADGTSVARVQVSAWSSSIAEADAIARAVRDRFDGFKGFIGRVEVTACLGLDDVELVERPKAGADVWTHQIAVDYLITHRVPLPSLLAS